jgi:hypothetical protein
MFPKSKSRVNCAAKKFITLVAGLEKANLPRLPTLWFRKSGIWVN